MKKLFCRKGTVLRRPEQVGHERNTSLCIDDYVLVQADLEESSIKNMGHGECLLAGMLSMMARSKGLPISIAAHQPPTSLCYERVSEELHDWDAAEFLW
jgi:hypothetical protein